MLRTSMPSQTFGGLLREYRVAATLSQEALAERAGLSLRGIADLERGRSRAPRLDTLRRLIDGLQVTEMQSQAVVDAARIATDALHEHHPRESGTPAPPVRDRRLPTYLTGLFGREEDAAAIGALLHDDDLRLLTLTGPAGVGKTRLAAHVAGQCNDRFADVVAFVNLAALRDPNSIGSAIAELFGLAETTALRLLDAVALALEEKHLLLVLEQRSCSSGVWRSSSRKMTRGARVWRCAAWGT